MEYRNKVTMSIEDWHKYDNDNEDYEFAYATIDFISTRPNTHKHIYSEEVIKEYAPTVVGKWVIAEYNPITNDATTHTNYQSIIGVVPNNAKVQYRYDSDGYLVASVDAVISKLYATEMYEVFRSNPKKSVSVEELVGFDKETEKYEDGVCEKNVVGFNICAITVLGDRFNPSVPKANIQITRMSEDSIELIEKEYGRYSKNNFNVDTITINDVMAKLEKIEAKLSKEETMAEDKETLVENSEVVENSLQEQVNADTENVEVEEMGCGSAKIEKAEEEIQVIEENPQNEEVVVNETEIVDEEKEAVENSEEKDLEKEKMAELETELNEAKELISKYEAEISELKAFKNSAEDAEKTKIVSETLAQIKDFCDTESYSKFEAMAEKCQYSDINGWRNEALASIANKALARMSELTSKEEGVLDMGMPTTETQKTSIYD